MTRKGKLELTWVNKDERQRLEPRILVEDRGLSHGDASAGNIVIYGDNLLALKALEQDFAGEIKCICIDPPYNTGTAFTQYDDGLEHSIWLSMMRDRLEMLQQLLSYDGSIWITIDDNEAHYLKVLCDEVFGRANFVANIVWQSKDTPGNNSSGIAETHNHILCYRKSAAFKPNLLTRSEKQLANYKNPDKDPRGPWLATPLTRAEHRDRDYYRIKNLVGREVLPPTGSSWRRPPEKMKELADDKRIWWGKDGDAEFPMEKKFLSEVKEGVVNQTWWPYEFAGSTRNASAEQKALFEGRKAFDTPKPEKLLQRILEIATKPGDIVLDSFAGSGTTGAVALKMDRRFIMVEIGDHCFTHIIPRIIKVIDGKDEGGISQTVRWKGGGGFKLYRLAETLLVTDPDFGTLDTNPRYTREMLYEAICKIENFRYEPRGFWHGHSSEKRFIHIALEMLNQPALDRLEQELRLDESLLIYYKKRASNLNHSDRVELKRIPRDLQAKCDFKAGV